MNIEYQKKNNHQSLALESRTSRRGFGLHPIILFIILYSLFLFPSSASAFQKPPNNLGLVGYWSLDDGSGTVATDFSGRGNNGTLVGGPTWNNGKRGKAVNFTGSGQKIDAGNSNTLFLAGQPVTLSAWIYPRTYGGSNFGRIFGRETGSDGPVLQFVTNKLYFQIDGATDLILQTNTDVPLNVWQHVLVTWDGSTTASSAHIYLNGVEQGYSSASDAVSFVDNSSATFKIGNSNSGGSYFDGFIDEARVYNRVVSSSEISALYRTGSAKFTTPSSTGLVGYWSMDDATSTIASDFSGNKNNGTLTTFTNPATPLSGWLTAGKHGGALTFDGTSDFVDVGNVSTLDMGTSDWTTSAWVKTGDTSSNPMMVSKMQFVGGAVDAWYMELLSSGRLHAGLFKGGRTIQNTADDGATINDNKWHHIAVTWTRSGNLLRYVDGVVTGTAKDISGEVGQSIANSQKAMIGARDGGAGNELFYKGSIDDVRVYRRALSASEISGLYRSGQVTTNASQNNKVTNGLIGLWSMNGQDITWGSNFMRDGSGNGNNGTLSSFSKTGSIDFGVNGQALKFDGSATQITTATQFSNPQTFSLSIWFKTTVASGHKLIGFGDSQLTDAGSYDRHIYMGTDGKIYFGWYPGSITTVVSLSTLNDGNWHHAVGTHNGTTGILYIDGVVQGTNTGSPQSYTGYWRIGGATLATWTNATNGYFSGLLDEARIYNRTISPEEIKQLYNIGRSL